MMTEQVPEIQEKPIQPETASEIPQNKNFFKKVSLLVLGLIVVTGAVYAGYFLGRKSIYPRELQPVTTQIPIDNGPVEIEVSPTPDPTAGWKTYRNEKYGYEFKYPSDWFLTEMPIGVTGGVDMLSSYKILEMQVKDPEFWRSKLKIDLGRMIDKKSPNQTLIEWFGDYEKGPGGQMLTKISQEIVSVDGKNTIKVVSESKLEDGAKNISYFIESNDFIYFISAGSDFNSKNQKTFDQILSTFKFLE